MDNCENDFQAKKTVVYVCKKWLLAQCLSVDFCLSSICDLLCKDIRDASGVTCYVCARERQLLSKKLNHLKVGYKKIIKKGGGRQRNKFLDSQCSLLLPCTVTVNSVPSIRLDDVIIPRTCPVRTENVHHQPVTPARAPGDRSPATSARAADNRQPVTPARAPGDRSPATSARAADSRQPVSPARAPGDRPPATSARAADSRQPVTPARAPGDRPPATSARAADSRQPVTPARAPGDRPPATSARAADSRQPVTPARAPGDRPPATSARAADNRQPVTPARAPETSARTPEDRQPASSARGIGRLQSASNAPGVHAGSAFIRAGVSKGRNLLHCVVLQAISV